MKFKLQPTATLLSLFLTAFLFSVNVANSQDFFLGSAEQQHIPETDVSLVDLDVAPRMASLFDGATVEFWCNDQLLNIGEVQITRNGKAYIVASGLPENASFLYADIYTDQFLAHAGCQAFSQFMGTFVVFPGDPITVTGEKTTQETIEANQKKINDAIANAKLTEKQKEEIKKGPKGENTVITEVEKTPNLINRTSVEFTITPGTKETTGGGFVFDFPKAGDTTYESEFEIETSKPWKLPHGYESTKGQVIEVKTGGLNREQAKKQIFYALKNNKDYVLVVNKGEQQEKDLTDFIDHFSTTGVKIIVVIYDHSVPGVDSVLPRKKDK